MFYVSSIEGNLVGIMDTYDNVEEFYSPRQLKEISKQVKIKGVSSKGIKKIDLGEALLTREIVKKINCEKSLSFEIVDNLTKYKLLGNLINNDFVALETGTDIKLLSDKIIMLDKPILVDEDEAVWTGLFEDTKFIRIDFHNTNTSNIENMGFMFYDCHATSLNLSSFNTSKVKDMKYMFRGCHAISLDLNNFNTSKVKSMECMFANCHATFLDLSSFDTSNVKDICSMFSGCHATSLDLSNFVTFNIKHMNSMFDDYKGTIKATDSRILSIYNARVIN